MEDAAKGKETKTGPSPAYGPPGDVLIIPIAETLAALPIVETYRGWSSGPKIPAGTMDDVVIGITGKEIRK